MKFMKLGSRPDTFFTAEATRSVPSEVSTDIKIQVQNSSYQLHKFPLLSKCGRLQSLCSGTNDSAVELHDIPGGAEIFELCAKFCYGIAITVSSFNFVPLRCAAEYLHMTDAIDRGNLCGKLDSFFKSCILRRWKDTLLTLQSTRQYHSLCEELRITQRCVEALASAVVADPVRPARLASKGWWAEDLANLGIDHYWRIMLAIKSGVVLSGKIIGDALQIYASRWLPILEQSPAADGDLKQRLLLEKIVSLLPSEKGSVPCSFLMKLIRAANIIDASYASKMELARRAGVQLEEATVNDLLIPSLPCEDKKRTLYDVDVVMTILEEFMIQSASPPTSPLRERYGSELPRRSRSAENIDFELQEHGRRSSSASHSAKLRVAKLIDLYLQEIASDPALPIENVLFLGEAVPDFARMNHDDLYRVIDTYLRAHPGLDKNERKRLCSIVDCKKLSVETCMHAAQNDQLPLRMVVQVLFFEQARAAMAGGQVAELPSNIKELLAKTEKGGGMKDEWIETAAMKCPSTKLATLRMKLAEYEDDVEDEAMRREGLTRSSSSRLRALCSIPSKPKRILSKFWSMNRSVSEKQRCL